MVIVALGVAFTSCGQDYSSTVFTSEFGTPVSEIMECIAPVKAEIDERYGFYSISCDSVKEMDDGWMIVYTISDDGLSKELTVFYMDGQDGQIDIHEEG